MHIDGMSIAQVIIAPYFIHQYFASKYPSRDCASNVSRSNSVGVKATSVPLTSTRRAGRSMVRPGKRKTVFAVEDGSDDAAKTAGASPPSELPTLLKIARTLLTNSRGLKGLTR